MAVRVVVPSRYDEFFNLFMSSLDRSQPGSSSAVIVMDNGLSQDTRDRWPWAQFVQVPADPFRYAHSINVGVKVAAPHDTLILGDDMQVITERWLDEVSEFMRRWPKEYGTINVAQQPGVPWAPVESKVAHGIGITMTPRSVWETVGPWDERYDAGYGYEDMDYCLQLFHRGLKVGTSGVVMVHHGGTKTWQKKLGSYEAVIEKCHASRRLFCEKWNLPDEQVIQYVPAEEHLAGTCGCPR
jgi:hypothetical protein